MGVLSTLGCVLSVRGLFLLTGMRGFKHFWMIVEGSRSVFADRHGSFKHFWTGVLPSSSEFY